MTTATLVTGNRTMTEVRPRRSLEELVDRLMAALFGDEPETAAPTTPQGLARSVHEARRLRQAGDIGGALAVPARHEHGEGGGAGGSMGLRRVDSDGEAAVRRPGRSGLQPEHGTCRRPRAPRRRLAGGGRGPGDA